MPFLRRLHWHVSIPVTESILLWGNTSSSVPIHQMSRSSYVLDKNQVKDRIPAITFLTRRVTKAEQEYTPVPDLLLVRSAEEEEPEGTPVPGELLKRSAEEEESPENTPVPGELLKRSAEEEESPENTPVPGELLKRASGGVGYEGTPIPVEMLVKFP